MSHVSVVAATAPDERTIHAPLANATASPAREVTADDVARTEPQSSAAKLRARVAKVENRQERFAVPPRDVWGKDLVMVARPVKLKDGTPDVAFIAQSTVDVLWRDDSDGELKPIEELDVEWIDDAGDPVTRKARPGWLGIGEVAGIITPENVARTSIGDVINRVFGHEDVIAVFMEQLVSWTVGRRSEVAAALGE
jgi:hypothetical protein